MSADDDDVYDTSAAPAAAEPTLPSEDKPAAKRQRQDAAVSVSSEKPAVKGFTRWRFTGSYSELCLEERGDGGKIIRHCRLCTKPVMPPKNGGWSNFQRNLYLEHKVSMQLTFVLTLNHAFLQPFCHQGDFDRLAKKEADKKAGKAVPPDSDEDDPPPAAAAAPSSAAALTAAVKAESQRRITDLFNKSTRGRIIDLAGLFAELSVNGEHAFRLCESPAMRAFVTDVAGPNTTLAFPSRNKVIRIIEQRFYEFVNQMALRLRAELPRFGDFGGRVSITLDGWSDKTMESFIVVTFHWFSLLHKGLQRFTAACEPFPSPHTTEQYLKFVQLIGYRFGLSASRLAALETWVTSVTTDNASNIVAISDAAKASWLKMRCVCHSMGRVIVTSTKSIVNHPIQTIMDDVSATMNLFTNSTLRRVHYASAWKRLRPNITLRRPLFLSATRWNAILLQFFATVTCTGC